MKIKCAEINLNDDTTNGALVIPLEELNFSMSWVFGDDGLDVGDVVTITITERDKQELENMREWDGW